MKKTPKKNKALMLRTCHKDMTSYGGFIWPEKGYVEAPDWNEEPKCGNGLHGLLWGEGDAGYLNLAEEAKWLVCEVDLTTVVWIDRDKIKTPFANVIYCGNREEAVNKINEHSPHTLCVFSTLTVGDRSTLTVGDRSTLTGGNYSTLTGGDNSTLTGGDYSALTGGDFSTLTGGRRSTLTGGNYSTLTGGNYSTLTGGNYSALTGGNYSALTGGEFSTLTIKKHVNGRLRLFTAYVGENGIKPNVKYRLNDNNEFEEVL